MEGQDREHHHHHHQTSKELLDFHDECSTVES